MSTLLAGSWLFDLQHLRQQLQDGGGGLLDDAGPIAGEVETLSGGLPLHLGGYPDRADRLLR